MALRGCRFQAHPKWRERVADRTVREPSTTPGTIGNPADEALQRASVDVRESDVLREVAQRVGGQQPAVFLARLLAYRVASAAGMSGDPCKRVSVQGRPAPLLSCFGVSRELDRARLGERRGELLTLTPSETVYGDVARSSAVDAWMGGALGQHACCCLVAHAVAHPEEFSRRPKSPATRPSTGDYARRTLRARRDSNSRPSVP
jgi:hypothetical protein